MPELAITDIGDTEEKSAATWVETPEDDDATVVAEFAAAFVALSAREIDKTADETLADWVTASKELLANKNNEKLGRYYERSKLDIEIFISCTWNCTNALGKI